MFIKNSYYLVFSLLMLTCCQNINNSNLNIQRDFVNDLLKAGNSVKQVEYYHLDHTETLNASLRDTVPLVLKILKK